MKLRDKSILLVSPENWDHIHISKHHYALELARRNNQVFFLGPPSSSYSKKEILKSKLYELTYRGFPKGLRFYPEFLRKRIQNSVLQKLEGLSESKFDILWSFDNSVFIDFQKSNVLFNISHIVDFSQNFSFSKVAKSADLNFSVSKNILSRQLEYNQNSYMIGHAIDEIFFDENQRQTKIELPGKNKLKAMTFGNMKSPYIDWGLAEKIYEKFDAIDFIHVGPYDEKKSWPDNVIFMGPQKKSNLPSLMQAMDFLFIFYDYKNNPQQLTNSHKILEYFSSGKPLICNQFGDYKDSELLVQCRNLEEYIQEINNAISNAENENLKVARINYSRQNTYGMRLDQIEKILEEF